MEKHALSKNESGRLDLPQDYLDDHNTRYYTVPVKSVIRDDKSIVFNQYWSRKLTERAPSFTSNNILG